MSFRTYMTDVLTGAWVAGASAAWYITDQSATKALELKQLAATALQSAADPQLVQALTQLAAEQSIQTQHHLLALMGTLTLSGAIGMLNWARVADLEQLARPQAQTSLEVGRN